MLNASLPGPFTFSNRVYAAPGLSYAASLNDFAPFNAPDLNYSTRTIDISDFADVSVLWPFAETDVPLNGFLRVPDGPGPFPLVLFAHGNHNPSENSTRGYLYLCELLASHGIIAGSIDVNFLNGGGMGENDARAIVHLEHVRQFEIWNTTSGHPLEGKVDLDRVMIVGHSRGGEAVGHASAFNRLNQVQPDPGGPTVLLDGSKGLGPYQFSLSAVVAIAPTDRQYIPVSGPTRVVDNYVVIHGSRDGDVFNFPGYQTYDRSHAVDLASPTTPASGYKALVWVFQANHNFFNSVWAQESPVPTLTRPQQELVAKLYFGSIARSELLGDTSFRELLQDHRIAHSNGWLPSSILLVSQYQSENRLFIQHCEEPTTSLRVSLPVIGTITAAAPIVASKLRFNLGGASHLFQAAFGVQLTWGGSLGSYTVQLNPATLPTAGFSHLSFRLGQSTETPNPAASLQNMTMSIEDGSGASTSFPLSQFGELLYPDTSPVGTAPKTIMQSFRIPLGYLLSQGVNVTNIFRIQFKMDLVSTGIIYLGDLQVSQ